MNAILNIQVRVAARAAAGEIRAVKAEIDKLGNGSGSKAFDNFSASADKFFGKLESGAGKLVSFGKNLQWTGRQLTMAFTLPILAAAAAATKWELQNETASTELRKVYGLVGESVSDVNSELETLDKTMDLLSRRFGVQKARVYDVAKAWAEAGLSGVGLQRAVQNTLEASVVGSIDLTKATEGLIAIQAAYRMSTVDIRKELANLDLIQVQSGVSFAGLIDVMARAGSTASVAGIDMRHLAAMAASITPAAGTAAQAGNALRTIISRMLVPSKDAAEMMAKMGISIDQASWSTKTGTERFEMLVQAINKLPDSQKIVVDSFIAGRFQLNRFTALVEDATKANGFYQRSLRNTNDPVKALNTYQQQLNTVLASNPQRLKILGVTLQNSLANVIQPMIPSLLGLVGRIVDLVTAFSHLSPRFQQFILAGLAFLAITGPIIQYLGSFILLFGQVGKAAIKAGEGVAWFVGQLIKSADTGLIGTFFEKIGQGFLWMAGLWDSMWARMFGRQTEAEVAMAEENQTAIEAMSAQMAELPAAMGAAGAAMEVETVSAGAAMVEEWTAAIGAITAEWLAYWLWLGTMMAAHLSTTGLGMTKEVEIWTSGIGFIGGEWLAYWLWLGAMMAAFLAASGLMVGKMAQEWGVALLAMKRGWASYWRALEAGMATFLALTTSVTGEAVVLWTGAIGAITEEWATFFTWLGGMLSAMLTSMGVAAGSTAGIWGTANTAAAETFLALPAAAGAADAAVVAETAAAAGTTVAIWEGAAAGGVAGIAAAAGAAGGFFSFILGIIASIGTFIASVGAFFGALWGWISAIGSWVVEAVVTAETFGEAVSGVLLAVSEGAAGIMGLIAASPALVVAAAAVAIAAVIALVVVFRNQIWDGIKWVARGFAQLPGAIAQSMIAVVKVIAMAVSKAVDWLSYLNPFARHSPSLVDYVTMGTQVISQKYKDLATSIASSLVSAANAQKAFGIATSGSQEEFDRAEYQKKRATIVKYLPGAATSTDLMITSIVGLKSQLKTLDPVINEQKIVVQGWNDQLDIAREKIQNAQQVLDRLRDTANATQDQLETAKQKLADFSNTPITGMRAMEDQIFANTMAQKKLQLAIMDMEDAYGSTDSIRDKLSKLQGQLEMLRGEQESLRQAGAGSEILGVYDEQIKALEDESTATQDQSDKVGDLRDQLDKLVREGQRLDLTKSLNFDGLQRQIDQASQSLVEMPFDQIMAGITTQKAEVARLTGVWDQQTAAVRDQQKVVDDLTASRDAMQRTYDTENEKLQALQQSYSDITDQIGSMETALTNMSSALTTANETPSMAQQLFDAPAADFPDVTGNTPLGAEPSTKADMDAYNKAIEEALKKAGEGFGKLDIFKPLKDQWKAAWNWIKDNIGPEGGMAALTGAIIGGFIGGPIGIAIGAILGPIILKATWAAVQAAWHWIRDALGPFLVGLFGDTVDIFKVVFSAIGDAAVWLWDHVLYPTFSTIGSVITAVAMPPLRLMGAVFSAVFGAIATVAGWVAGVIVGAFKGIAAVLGWIGGIFETVFGAIAAVAGWLWDTALEPVFSTMIDFFNSYIFPILQLFGAIWAITFGVAAKLLGWFWDSVVKPVFGFIVGHLEWAGLAMQAPLILFMWFVQNVLAPVFGWLLDTIIKPVFNAIGTAISWAWDSVIKPVFEAIDTFIRTVLGAVFNWLLDTIIKPVWDAIGTAISWAWDGVIKPVFGAIDTFIRTVLGTVFTWLKDDIVKPVWEAIGTAISFAWNSVIKPVFDGMKWFIENVLAPVFSWLKDSIIKPIFDAIGTIIGGAWSGIKTAVKSFANFFIRVFNTIADGIKAIGDFVGVTVNIQKMPLIGEDDTPDPASVQRVGRAFASGGVLPTTTTAMGVFKEARAIVGEGSKLYPEYVIPTDPRYRSQALKLYQDAGTAFMASGGQVPTSHGKSIWDRVTDVAGDVAGGVAGAVGGAIDEARRAAVIAMAQPFLLAADQVIGLIPNDVVQGSAKWVKNTAYDWMKGDKAVPALFHGAVVKGSAAGTLVRVGDRNQDEMIKPLPRNADTEARTINFYGDLEFPNVKNGDDAEDFIRNLRTVS